MKQIEFPRYIDDPPSFLIVRMDDVMPAVVALIAGILTDQLFLFLLIGFGVSYGYSKFRDRQPDGYALHWLYWVGLLPWATRTIRNPFERRYIP